MNGQTNEIRLATSGPGESSTDPGTFSPTEHVQESTFGQSADDETSVLLNPQKKSTKALSLWDRLKRVKRKTWGSIVKTVLLVGLLLFAAVAFGMTEEVDIKGHLYVVSNTGPTTIDVNTTSPFLDMTFRVQTGEGNLTIKLADYDGIIRYNKTVEIPRSDEDILTVEYRSAQKIRSLVMSSTGNQPAALLLEIDHISAWVEYDVVMAALILVLVYVLIIFEIVHRALASILGSFLALGALSLLDKQPPLEEIVGWIDYETVMLLFGMMVIVGILSETGVFEFMAVKAYRWSGGRVWRLLTILCVFSAVVSAFLDNVTTILLLTPVTIRMASVIGLDPTPILLGEVIFSNIGGTATAVGDPPNVIIVSTSWVDEDAGHADIEFLEFTLHMALGILFVAVGSYFGLRFLYRKVPLDNPDPPDVAALKNEIQIWRRTLSRMQSTSQEEDTVRTLLNSKIKELESMLLNMNDSVHQTWAERLHELEHESKIKNKELLVNSGLVLAVVITMFFVHSAPSVYLDLGWIAVLGAVLLLIVSGIHDLEALLERVEWGTLLFFASLFILMEALAELGLISWIGDQTAELIRGVPADSRLSVAIIVVLWISALASSFVDNIPFTTAMIPVIKSIAADSDVDLPLRPLVWALAFGACLGGNGTLIGASANVVCAGLAEQEGISITFNRFFKIGFPIMLMSTTIAMFYLLICHSAIGWDENN